MNNAVEMTLTNLDSLDEETNPFMNSPSKISKNSKQTPFSSRLATLRSRNTSPVKQSPHKIQSRKVKNTPQTQQENVFKPSNRLKITKEEKILDESRKEYNCNSNLNNDYLEKLFYHLAKATSFASKYYGKEAISIFKKLPINQLETSWVYAQIGRCYQESGQFPKVRNLIT